MTGKLIDVRRARKFNSDRYDVHEYMRQSSQHSPRREVERLRSFERVPADSEDVRSMDDYQPTCNGDPCRFWGD
jgi:hypothetical protein